MLGLRLLRDFGVPLAAFPFTCILSRAKQPKVAIAPIGAVLATVVTRRVRSDLAAHRSYRVRYKQFKLFHRFGSFPRSTPRRMSSIHRSACATTTRGSRCTHRPNRPHTKHRRELRPFRMRSARLGLIAQLLSPLEYRNIRRARPANENLNR